MANDLKKREKQEVNSTAAEQINNSGHAYSPDVDIYASDDIVLFAVDLPGVGKGNVTIHVDETNSLIIRAKNSQKEPNDTFQLSDDYDKDKVQATLENGLLQITIPKKESVKPKQIEIKA